MSEQYTIYEDFRPDLDISLSVPHQKLLKAWGMNKVGVPILSRPETKSALWHGRFSQFGQAPVMVLTMPQGVRFGSLESLGSQWMYGVAEESAVPEEETERTEAYAGVVEFMAPDRELAVHGLSLMLPARHFAELPEEQLSDN